MKGLSFDAPAGQFVSKRQTRPTDRPGVTENLEQLKELERLRDDLVHMIAHDMRTPLTSMLVHLELLKQDLTGNISDQNMADIDTALESGQRLNRMADEILDVSRLEARKMPLALGPCDLVEIVGVAVQNTTPEREQVTIEARGPVQVQADATIIGRVVENLVGNGLKHTPEGRLVVAVSSTDAEREARVAVRDFGAGVPEELQEVIFEKFATARVRKQYHTAGLGLAFCKLAVEAHGGRIGVDSQEGRGSTFWFTLPAGATELG